MCSDVEHYVGHYVLVRECPTMVLTARNSDTLNTWVVSHELYEAASTLWTRHIYLAVADHDIGREGCGAFGDQGLDVMCAVSYAVDAPIHDDLEMLPVRAIPPNMKGNSLSTCGV